jgi:hypothetical protein
MFSNSRNSGVTVTISTEQISKIQQVQGQPILVASDSPLKG